MFFPNTRCDLYSRKAVTNNFGKPTYASKVSVPCAVLYLDVAVAKSSVRADTSGTRGQAEQEQGDAAMLFPKRMALKVGDVVFKDDKWLEVTECEPRRDVLGKLDHHQVIFRKIEKPI
jgi:hypothetical protein